MMNLHEKYMQRCLELARKSFGKVAPNPMVGCVIVDKGSIIAEGYHREYGRDHAEVNAIRALKGKQVSKGAILYVNLEPCSHFGKTPPCADLIIKTGFKYVVIGTLDPNPLVAGKGIQKLVSAGIDVKLGILENESRKLNKRFYTFFEEKRPYIILKWAETQDRMMGGRGKRIQISGAQAQKLVHQWRGEEQAILVGTNTALIDNPRLTVRKVKGKNPLRVVLDRKLRIPAKYHLLDGSTPTLIFTGKARAPQKNLEYVAIDFKGNIFRQVLSELQRRNIQSVMVEGGAKLLRSFIDADLWDEARFIVSDNKWKQLAGRTKGIKAPEIDGYVVSHEEIGKDMYFVLQ